MSVQFFNRTIPVSGVIELQGGNFLLFLSATAAVNVRVERGEGGHAEQFDALTGGFLCRRMIPWNNLRILGAAGTTVQYFVGQETTDQDEVDIRLQIATIAGTAAVAIQPAATLSNTPAVAAANALQSTLFAANPLRRRMTVTADSDNLAGAGAKCFARTVGGANNIQELQPGGIYNFDGIYGVEVRNDSGALATFYLKEEV